MGTHNSPTLLIPFWTLTFRLCFQTNAIFAKVNRLWLLIAISIFCAGKWPTTTGFVRWRLDFGSNPKFIQWLSTISTETRWESRSRQSHISTLQSTATRTPTDQSRITFPARSNRSLFNSTLRNASYKSSSAIQTSSNRPLSASTLQSVTSQSSEPVNNIIIPTWHSQSQQSSASHTLSKAIESTTTQSTLSQPSPSGDITIRWCHNSATWFYSIRSKSVIDYYHQRIINRNPFASNTTILTTSIQSDNMSVQSNLLPGFLTSLDQQIDNESSLDLLPAVLPLTSAMEREPSAASTDTNVSAVDTSQATAVISSIEKNM